ncbi:MAG: (d)CMP kinase [Terriglobia bacterium]
MRTRLVIAIDGPSGVGKSTVAQTLAARLGYCYVESGAMYRAVALLALETGTDLRDSAALGRLAAKAAMRFETEGSRNRLLLGNRDITEAVRTPEVTEASSRVSVHAAVRTELVARQRALGRAGGVVMEGRDIGTKVFPDAGLKLFLDATPEVRSERRLRDLAGAGAGEITRARVLQEMQGRDRRDRERDLSPLVPAKDSIYIDTTPLTADEVVERILELVERKIEN